MVASLFAATILPQLSLWGIAHTALAYLMLLAVALHIAGALKHHLVDRDGTLRRMLGRKLYCPV
jgi:cytochrome b561